MENDEQKHLAKYIKEFKRKTSAEDSNLKMVEGDVLNSTMVLLKGRETVFKAFGSEIFLKFGQSKYSEQSDQSDLSSSDDKYTSLKLYNYLNT